MITDEKRCNKCLENKADPLVELIETAAKRYKESTNYLQYIANYKESHDDYFWRPTLDSGKLGNNKFEAIIECGEAHSYLKGLCSGMDCLLAGYPNYENVIGTCIRRVSGYYNDFKGPFDYKGPYETSQELKNHIFTQEEE